MTEEERAETDAQFETLKKMRDEGAISDEEYKERAKRIFDKWL